MRDRRFRVHHEAGNAIVEFALGSMIFFTLLFGIVEFGLAVSRYNMVSNLAQEGARRATVCGTKTALTSGCDIDAYVRSRAVIPITSVTVTPANLSTLTMGTPVSVRVATTVAPLTQLVPHTTFTLSSTVRMIAAR